MGLPPIFVKTHHPVIVDTDLSFDDYVALLYLLQHPDVAAGASLSLVLIPMDVTNVDGPKLLLFSPMPASV